MIAPDGRADAGAFLARLRRLDPRALVRLRPAGADLVQLWAMLPFGVLVMRTLPATTEPDGGEAPDQTVEAAALLETLADPQAPAPRRQDQRWLWPLPPSRGRAVETLPAAEVARVAEAASRTLRTASTQGLGGRAVGERVMRDALLDHVPIVVTDAAGERIDVPQRMVQAVVRMGFLGPSKLITARDNMVTVRLATGWIGLDGSYGCAWYRPSSPLRIA